MKEVFGVIMVVGIVVCLVLIFVDAYVGLNKAKREKIEAEKALKKADQEETERLKKEYEELKKNYK